MSFFTSRWDLLQKLQRRTSPVPVFFVIDLPDPLGVLRRHLTASRALGTNRGPGSFPGSRPGSLPYDRARPDDANGPMPRRGGARGRGAGGPERPGPGPLLPPAILAVPGGRSRGSEAPRRGSRGEGPAALLARRGRAFLP